MQTGARKRAWGRFVVDASLKKKNLYIYIYLEPVCPLVLDLIPSKKPAQTPFQNKGPHLGSRSVVVLTTKNQNPETRKSPTSQHPQDNIPKPPKIGRFRRLVIGIKVANQE